MTVAVRAQGARAWLLDACRGAAVLWMVLFHLGFDLAVFRLWHQNFYADPFWLWQRTIILTTFLALAACSQVVAVQAGLGWPRFWRRWLQVLACALGVSLASWWVFPRSYISFGVLHAMVLLMPLGRGLAVRWLARSAGKDTAQGQPWRAAVLVMALGLVALVMPELYQHPWFDTRWTNWVGLVTHKPITEDFVPLLPWGGVFLMSLGATVWWVQARPVPLEESRWGRRAPGRLGQGLAWLGRHSLSVYMLHQPLFFGLLTLVTHRG